MGKINELAHSGADFNEQDEMGYTPLHHAAERGSAFVTLKLPGYSGVQIDARENKWQRTPLHLAANECRPKHVAALIYAGADVNAQDMHGLTPLHVATLRDANMRHLSSFTCYQVAIIATLILYGADVNARGKDGETPLHCAACRGNLVYIDALMRGGADINARDNNDCTPLHEATKKGNAVADLTERGADVNVQDADGNTPLHLTLAENRDYHCLIEGKADVNMRNKKGETPLHFAVGGNAVKSLIEAGAKVNARNEKGETPMEFAMRKNRKDVVAALAAAMGGN